MSENRCPYLEGCPIFKYFQRVAKRVYMDLYCLGNYPTCARHKLRTAGQPVPENLLPYGGKLWDDKASPPETS